MTVARSEPNLTYSSYLMVLPILGSLLMFGAVLAFEGTRLAARRREASLQAAQSRYEREQLLRADLESALEKAQAAETARREMLGVLGHEMRTPVLSAIAALQMFPEDLKARDPRGYLSLAEKGLLALQSLIDDILDLARLRAGEIRFENAPMDLTELLGEVADIMEPMAVRHHLGFQRAWPDGRVEVTGDRARLRQILINLVSNALRYTREGHVELGGAWQIRPDNTCQIRLSVSDTGPGIPDDKIAEIFKPFYRLEQGVGDRIKGLGLGLPITERLAKAMGGAIEVRSRPGHGSTFCLVIDLPIAPDAVPGDRPGDTGEEIGSLSGKSVLLVEDHPLQAQMVAAVLGKLQAKTEIATMGLEALDAAKRQTFDFILIDLGLPDMSGVELVQRLKQAGSGALHIALSANPASLDAEQRAEFDIVATKTTSKGELERLLRGALQSR